MTKRAIAVYGRLLRHLSRADFAQTARLVHCEPSNTGDTRESPRSSCLLARAVLIFARSGDKSGGRGHHRAYDWRVVALPIINRNMLLARRTRSPKRASEHFAPEPLPARWRGPPFCVYRLPPGARRRPIPPFTTIGPRLRMDILGYSVFGLVQVFAGGTGQACCKPDLASVGSFQREFHEMRGIGTQPVRGRQYPRSH